MARAPSIFDMDWAGFCDIEPARLYGRVMMDSTLLAALVFQIALGALGVILGALLLYAVIRSAITHGMRAYKRWERSGEP